MLGAAFAKRLGVAKDPFALPPWVGGRANEEASYWL